MKVIVIYGSPNDKPFMEPAREYFAQENVPYEETVLSAHRDLPELIRFLGNLEASGEKAVILAVAGPVRPPSRRGGDELFPPGYRRAGSRRPPERY